MDQCPNFLYCSKDILSIQSPFSLSPQQFALHLPFFSHLRNCTTFVRFQKIVSLNFCRIQTVLVLLWYRQFRTVQMFILVLLILLAITNHRKDENRNRSKIKQFNICRKSPFFSFLFKLYCYIWYCYRVNWEIFISFIRWWWS